MLFSFSEGPGFQCHLYHAGYILLFTCIMAFVVEPKLVDVVVQQLIS